MATRLPDAKRDEVLDLARAAGLPRNEVARRAGVSPRTVTRVCSAAGVTFDRAATEQATRARVVDTAAERAEQSDALLDDLAAARAMLRAQIAAGEAQAAMWAARVVGSVTGAHARLVALQEPDTDRLDRTRSLLTGMSRQLGLPTPDDDPETHL
jgi:hypothetical protein